MREASISFPMFGDNFIIDPPYCLQIGTFKIYFYGIIIAFGLVMALVYASRNCKKFGTNMDDIYDTFLWALPISLVTTRLYYVIFNFSLYKDNLMSIFAIRDGGLAIYGGVIGAALVIIIRNYVKKRSPWPLLDVTAVGLLIGQSIGRWGNFFNREAYGYTTDIFCRMGLTLPGQETIYVHPTFLYESLWNFIGIFILHWFNQHKKKYYGQVFTLYVFWYGLGRMFIEGLRSDSLWLIDGYVKVSQLLAACSMLAAVILLLINDKRLKAGKKPVLGHEIPPQEEECLDKTIKDE